MPVAFRADRVLLVHSLGMFNQGLDNDRIPVMEFPLDQDLEDRITPLPDLVRDDFWDQEERNALNLFRYNSRTFWITGHRLPPREYQMAAPHNSE